MTQAPRQNLRESWRPTTAAYTCKQQNRHTEGQVYYDNAGPIQAWQNGKLTRQATDLNALSQVTGWDYGSSLAIYSSTWPGTKLNERLEIELKVLLLYLESL